MFLEYSNVLEQRGVILVFHLVGLLSFQTVLFYDSILDHFKLSVVQSFI